MTANLRPLSIGELLDRSFSVYRQKFLVFVTLAAIPALMVFAAQLLFAKFISGASNAATTGTTDFNFAAIGIGVLIGAPLFSVVFLFVSALAHGALINTTSAVVFERPTSISESLSAMRGNLARTAGVIFVTGLLTGLGFVLLIVPGFILALRWALTLPSTILEKAGVSESWERSTFLTEGSRGRIFLIGFLYFVIFYALTMVLTMPVMAMLTISMVKSGGNAPVIPFWYLAANYASAFVVNCLVTPILTIALTLQYYDSRVRKEALDLQMLMDNASAATAGAPSA